MSSPLFGDDIRKLTPVIQPGQSDSGIFDNVLELLVHGWQVPRARPDDDGARGLRAALPHERGQARILRVPRGHHGAVGRPGRHLLQRRDHRRLDPGQERPAARAVGGHAQRPGRPGLRGRRPGHPARGRAAEGTPGAGQDVPGGHGAEEDHLRQRGESLRVPAQAVPPLAGGQPHRAARACSRSRALSARTTPRCRKSSGCSATPWKTSTWSSPPWWKTRRSPSAPWATTRASPCSPIGPQILYNYFKQLFAQVTNPPIDPYRENLVMSLMSYVGREKNLLEETPEHVRQVKLPHPILSNDDIGEAAHAGRGRLPLLRHPHDLPGGAPRGRRALEKALDALCAEAEARVDAGYTMLILTDRDVNAKQRAHPRTAGHLGAPSPPHPREEAPPHRAGHRDRRGARGDAFRHAHGVRRERHQPVPRLETIADLKARGRLSAVSQPGNGHRALHHLPEEGPAEGHVQDGCLHDPQLQERPDLRGGGTRRGFRPEVLPRHSRPASAGVGIEAIAREVLSAALRRVFPHTRAAARPWIPAVQSTSAAFSEGHRLSAQAIALIQRAVRENDYGLYQQYAASINDESRSLCTLRGLFAFAKRDPVPLDEVEPVESHREDDSSPPRCRSARSARKRT